MRKNSKYVFSDLPGEKKPTSGKDRRFALSPGERGEGETMNRLKPRVF